MTTDLVKILVRCTFYVDFNVDNYITFKMRFIQRVTNKIPSSGSKIRRKKRKLFFLNVDATFLASTDQTSLKEKKTIGCSIKIALNCLFCVIKLRTSGFISYERKKVSPLHILIESVSGSFFKNNCTNRLEINDIT